MSEVFVMQPGGGLLGYATDAECISACLAEITRLQAALATAHTRGAEAMREAAAKAVEGEAVEIDPDNHCPTDVSYNLALMHSAATIRALPLPQAAHDGERG